MPSSFFLRSFVIDGIGTFSGGRKCPKPINFSLDEWRLLSAILVLFLSSSESPTAAQSSNGHTPCALLSDKSCCVPSVPSLDPPVSASVVTIDAELLLYEQSSPDSTIFLLIPSLFQCFAVSSVPVWVLSG